jgi:hypothetical protein
VVRADLLIQVQKLIGADGLKREKRPKSFGCRSRT